MITIYHFLSKEAFSNKTFKPILKFCHNHRLWKHCLLPPLIFSQPVICILALLGKAGVVLPVLLLKVKPVNPNYKKSKQITKRFFQFPAPRLLAG